MAKTINFFRPKGDRIPLETILFILFISFFSDILWTIYRCLGFRLFFSSLDKLETGRTHRPLHAWPEPVGKNCLEFNCERIQVQKKFFGAQVFSILLSSDLRVSNLYHGKHGNGGKKTRGCRQRGHGGGQRPDGHGKRRGCR